jgi:hypothetical protein
MFVQAGQRSLSMQGIISTPGAVSPLHQKEWVTIFLQLHGIFGWLEITKFLTMPTPLLDA